MIECPTPTRAEASDVATAICKSLPLLYRHMCSLCLLDDGADAIMLSAESAAGKYPEESVTMQQRIINRVESDSHYRSYLKQNAPVPESTATDAVITSAREISKTIGAKAIVCFSLRGSTVSRASKMRPSAPILALCPFKETSRQLALSWGVYPDLPETGSYGYSNGTTKSTDQEFDSVLRNACRAALKKGLVSDPEDLLVVTAGLPFGTPGAAVSLNITLHSFRSTDNLYPIIRILSVSFRPRGRVVGMASAAWTRPLNNFIMTSLSYFNFTQPHRHLNLQPVCEASSTRMIIPIRDNEPPHAKRAYTFYNGAVLKSMVIRYQLPKEQ